MPFKTLLVFFEKYLLSTSGSRRGVIGGAVGLGRCVSLVASPVRRAVVQCILPVGSLYLDENVRQWLRIWVSGPFVGLCTEPAGSMFHFWCPVPV